MENHIKIDDFGVSLFLETPTLFRDVLFRFVFIPEPSRCLTVD